MFVKTLLEKRNAALQAAETIKNLAETEKRSLTTEEEGKFKAHLEEARKLKTQVEDAEALEVELRSPGRKTAPAPIEKANARAEANALLRAITKGGSEVGNAEVVADIVRVYDAESPMFANHTGKQLRLTGTKYSYPKFTAGSGGYAKTEGNAATDDSGSSLTMVDQTFKTYSSQTITVSQETLDDAGFDLVTEITALGMSKSTKAFDSDAVDALVSADVTPTETATTSWALSDVINAYYEIPTRHRQGVKFYGPASVIKAIGQLLTADKAPQAALIGLSKDTLVEDENIDAGLLIVANLTKAIAIGMKSAVRVFVDEVSAGRTFEAQPRMAVGLRDATAVAFRLLKTS